MMFGDEESDDEPKSDEAISASMLLNQRPKACGVLSFHNGTEDAMLLYVEANAQRGNPSSILKAIDRFCFSRHWMMHIGDEKAHHLTKGIKMAKEATKMPSANSLRCLEVGSYCGYSAILIAMELDHTREDKLFSVEADNKCVRWTTRLLEFAGLQDRVEVIHGQISDAKTLVTLMESRISPFDLLFIDHDKRLYLSDLLIIENSGLMKSGCVVVADNILSFGKPLDDYLSHVRDPNGPYSQSTLYRSSLEYSVAALNDSGTADENLGEFLDGVEISIYK